MESDISVKVQRAAIPEGTSLSDFVQKVNKAIRVNYTFFGAKDRWSVWSKEVFTNSVIVHVCDGVSPKFYTADMSMDTNGNVIFSNLQEVEMVITYVPKTTIERSQDEFELITIKRSGLFDNVING